MTTTIAPVGTESAALSQLSAGLGDYRDQLELTRLSDADLVAELRGLETVRRRLHALDHPLLAELDRRGVGAACGARSTAGLLQTALRLSPRDAHARALAARMLGPRTSLTGDPLDPVAPAAAAAAADGLLSDEHIARILEGLTDLPSGLPPEDRDAADTILTHIASQSTPRDVAAAATRLRDTLNPDGDQPDDNCHEPSRGLTLHRRRDGSYQLTGRLTPECGIQTEAVLNAYAAPRPTVNIDDGVSVPDQRSPTQRRHDALHDLTNLALHADTLQHTGRRAELIITTTAHTEPDSESPSADVETPDVEAPDADVADADVADAEPDTVLADDAEASADAAGADTDAPADEVSADTAQADAAGASATGTDAARGDSAPGDPPPPATSRPNYQQGLDTALRQLRLHHRSHTSTGNPLTTRTATQLCDTALVTVVTVGADGQILNHGRARRHASKTQLRVLIARDLGCSFPGCDHPPQWCDVHHITEWANGGPTNLDNLTLVCGYHHRGFARMGWTCQINNGIPYWTPPKHIDPHQKPIRNHTHLIR